MKRFALTLLTLALAGARGFAQEASGPTIALHAVQTISGTVGLGERETTREAVVDEARWVVFMVASSEELAVRLHLPDGSTFSAEDKETEDREWHVVRGSAEADPLFPGIGTGHNTIIRIVAPPAGPYELRLGRVKPQSETAPFVITVLQDSDVRMGLWLASARVVPGAPLVLAAVLADGAEPARDVALRARFVREVKTDAVEPAGECALVDDGREADAKEGDGVYTCVFAPPSEGRFWAAVEARGTTRAGLPFTRNGGVFLLAAKPAVEARVDGK